MKKMKLGANSIESVNLLPIFDKFGLFLSYRPDLNMF